MCVLLGNESEKATATSTFEIVFFVFLKFYEKMNKRPFVLSAQVKIEKFNKRPGRLLESLRYCHLFIRP